MRSDGSKHSSFSVPNNRDGAKLIVDRVASVLLAQNIPSAVIGMEATSVYGDNLMYCLRERGSLGRFERHLHILNPKQVKKFKDTYLDKILMKSQMPFSVPPKNSYRPPQVIADSARQMLAISMSTIRLLQKQVKEYDKAIEKQLQSIPQTLTSIKGISNVYAAGIIDKIGDINRFSGQASLAKYAGLVWSQHQSSAFDAEDKHMIHGGNHHLKYYLCEAANYLRTSHICVRSRSQGCPWSYMESTPYPHSPFRPEAHGTVSVEVQ